MLYNRHIRVSLSYHCRPLALTRAWRRTNNNLRDQCVSFNKVSARPIVLTAIVCKVAPLENYHQFFRPHAPTPLSAHVCTVPAAYARTRSTRLRWAFKSVCLGTCRKSSTASSRVKKRRTSRRRKQENCYGSEWPTANRKQAKKMYDKRYSIGSKGGAMGGSPLSESSVLLSNITRTGNRPPTAYW